MPELRQFIKSNVCSFVKSEREKANLSPDIRLNGYTLREVEERAHEIPLCELFPILKYVSNDRRLGEWWVDFQIETNKRKNQKGDRQ